MPSSNSELAWHATASANILDARKKKRTFDYFLSWTAPWLGIEKYALMREVPHSFHRLDQARTCLFDIMADGHAFLLEAAEFFNLEGLLKGVAETFLTRFKMKSPEADQQKPESRLELHGPERDTYPMRMRHLELTGPLPQDPMLQDIAERQARCLGRFEQWQEAFERSRLCIQGEEGEGAACLMMYYYISTIFLIARLSRYQTVFDQYTDAFREVVRLAEIYVQSKSSERPSFTFELGAVPALFVVALKCRVPSIRRKAIELILKSPGKESIFGAGGSGELAARIVAIEEEDTGLKPPPVSPVGIPTYGDGSADSASINDLVMPSEDRRVHNFELLVNRAANCFELRVTRYSESANGRRVKMVSDYLL